MYKFVLVIISLFYGIHTINAQEIQKAYGNDRTNIFHHSKYFKSHNAYIVLGSENDSTPTITKIDLNGNIIWSKKYSGKYYTFELGEISVPNRATTDIIITLSEFGTYQNLYVMRINGDNGNVVWTKRIRYASENWFSNFVITNDNHIIAATTVRYSGGVFFTKLDINGNVIWTKLYNKSGGFQKTCNFVPDNGNGFIFGFSNGISGIIGVSFDGNINYIYKTNNYSHIRSITKHPENGYVISSYLNWNKRATNNELIYIDNSFNIVWKKIINPSSAHNGDCNDCASPYSIVNTKGEIINIRESAASGTVRFNFSKFDKNGNHISSVYGTNNDLQYLSSGYGESNQLFSLGSTTRSGLCLDNNRNGLFSIYTDNNNICDTRSFTPVITNSTTTLSIENKNIITVTTPAYTETNINIVASDNQLKARNVCSNQEDKVYLGPDLLLCNSNSTLLNAGAGYKSYLWSNGSTNPTINVSTSGTYWVRVIDDCDNTSRDTIRVTFGTNKTTNNPVSLCPGQTYTINNKTYSVAGTYRDTLKTSIGCDSVVVTNLSFTNCGTPISGVVNKYSAVTKISCNTITVENGANFSVGNRVLLIQMQGAKVDTSNTVRFGTIVDYRSAGLYEFNTVLSKSGNNIVLEKGLNNSYNIDGRVQLVYVPVFTDVYIQNEVTGTPWNGKIGGIIAIEASGTIRLGSKINADGIGFRGGKVRHNNVGTNFCEIDIFRDKYSTNRGGQKGEGIAVWDSSYILNKGSWANGGGGGNNANSGGGGGSNASLGGKGGKIYYDPSFPICNGGNGIPGNIITPSQSKIFLGGAGGAGHQNDNAGSSGGNGGGLVIIKTNSIIGNNHIITSNGLNSLDVQNDGAGGGGAGGTIFIESIQLSNLEIISTGGKGGDNLWTSYRQCHGTGGGGSGGVIITTGTETNVAKNILKGGHGNLGYTSSTMPSACGSLDFGAEAGNDGKTFRNFKVQYSSRNISNDTIIIDTTVCFGKSIVVGNTTYSTSGTFYQNTVNTNGCPIVTKITLLVLSQNIKTQNLTICQGQSVRVGNNFYSETGIYKDTLTSTAGCDSIVTTRLQVFDTHQIEVNYNICLGDSVKIGNSVYKSSGLYTDVLKNINGCDSIVKSNIQVNIPTQNNISYKLCPGDSIEWSGNYYFTEGLYRDTLTSSLGCDSVYTTIQIEFVKSLTLDLGKDTMVCHDEILQIGTDQKDLDYLWSTGSTESYIDAVAPRVYSLTISNQCYSISDTIQIDAIDCDCTVFIPNAFSPNGDGKNDILLVKEKNISHSKLIIYNKWGEEIFEVFDNEISWNGMKKDKHLAPDVYGYYYVGECLKGNKIELKGNITIVR